MAYSQHYLVRGCDFIRLQVFYIASFIACVAGYFAFNNATDFLYIVAGAVLIMFLQGKWIYPYTWLAKKRSAKCLKTHCAQCKDYVGKCTYVEP